ncbi:Peroxiredoxin-like FAM213/AAED1 [Trinorchestia longiramus]|nr:Peroxiredoxin-like FAM213/AAED1 [Trinorchestia longiramus]
MTCWLEVVRLLAPHCVLSLRLIIDDVFAANSAGFMEGIGVLVGGIDAYTALYRSTGMRGKAEVEAAVGGRGRDVRTAAEALLDAEQNWDAFLTKVEEFSAAQLGPAAADMLQVGDLLPGDIPLYIVGDDLKTTLQSVAQDSLSEAGVQVVVVTFGGHEGALQWQQQTGCPFVYCRNPDLSLYQALALRRTVEVWSTSTLSYYGSIVAQGVELPKVIPQKNLQDDPHQMGADVTVDRDGRIVFVHRSVTVRDRPSVDGILAATCMR